MKSDISPSGPYRWLPEEEILKNRAFFAVSNSLFDRDKAADDYNYYLDEYCYAEELGFDVVALNEHHGNPFCMGSVMNVEASILAQIDQTRQDRPDRQSAAGHQASACAWRRNWPRSTSFRAAAWSPDGCAARAASSSSTTPIPPTTARCSTRRTTSSCRPGPGPGRGATRASISITAT